jgi:hypothetical protein
MSQVSLPLLFDHLKEVTMIDYALEHRSKSESVVTTECSRESDDWDFMTQFGRVDRGIRIPYIGIKMRQEAAVSEEKKKQ